jgi:hypothetical protein
VERCEQRDTPQWNNRAVKWPTFVKRVASVLWPFAHPYVPSYDPLARRRVRAAADALVTLKCWPGKEATSKEAAQLAVRRSLDLQRLTRTSSRLRQFEAASLLARSSLETTIIGIWCVVDESAIQAMQRENAYSFERMMTPLVGSMFLPPGAIKTAVGKLGTPAPFTLKKPLKAIKKAESPSAAQGLYDTYYSPLSAFFGHGRGVALLRHVRWEDRIAERAAFPWAKRSPSHLADLCLGILCCAVAGPDHPDYELFRRYACYHDRRTASPLGGMAAGHLIRDLRPSPSRVASAFREMQDAVEYTMSPDWKEIAHPEKVARVEQALTAIFGAFGMITADLSHEYAVHLVYLIDAREASSPRP